MKIARLRWNGKLPTPARLSGLIGNLEFGIGQHGMTANVVRINSTRIDVLNLRIVEWEDNFSLTELVNGTLEDLGYTASVSESRKGSCHDCGAVSSRPRVRCWNCGSLMVGAVA